MSEPVGRRSVLVALSANLGVAAAKFVGFLITGSASLLAETFHSVADSGNQVLLLLGGHLASEQPSPQHPFGRGRERYFWAFVVGLVLFGLGGVFAIHEGWTSIRSSGHEVTSPRVALGLILVATVIEGLSLRTGVAEANLIRPEGQSWHKFVRRTRNPEVTVVLLEDGAALVGLLIALVGVVGSWTTGNSDWDAAASMAIGLLLCFVASVLTVEMKSLLIGETVAVASGLKAPLDRFAPWKQLPKARDRRIEIQVRRPSRQQQSGDLGQRSAHQRFQRCDRQTSPVGLA